MHIHIGSDLHIEQWDPDTYTIRHPFGSTAQYPFHPDLSDCNTSATPDAPRVLIVAGDVSDDIDLSLSFLNRVSADYTAVLYVDGNHEHVHRFPNLYTTEDIAQRFRNNRNPKVMYLPSTPFCHQGTAFVGVNGWWNYSQDTPATQEFRHWIPHMNDRATYQQYKTRVRRRAYEDSIYLRDTIQRMNDDASVKRIVVVTHSIPLKSFTTDTAEPTECNTYIHSMIQEWVPSPDQKVQWWVFGHTHRAHYAKHNHIQFICHPRGRPDDFQRYQWRLLRAKL